MQIVISPAKQMTSSDEWPTLTTPAFLTQTQQIVARLQAMSATELQQLWQCSEHLVAQNQQRLAHLDFQTNLTPAIMSYSGLQYQSLAPGVLTQGALAYLQTHLWILSALYGANRPFDGIQPYRLSLVDHLPGQNLVEIWRPRLAPVFQNEVIVNLASREYAQLLPPQATVIEIVFQELNTHGKLVTKATRAKQARGQFVRWLAEQQIDDPAQLTAFHELGYQYQARLSTAIKLVFVR